MSGHQKDLFDVQPEPWEMDDAAHQLVATVVFAEGAEGEFDYLVPDTLREEVTVGQRLQVPLGRGNRPVIGYCVRLEVKPVARRLKDVRGVLDPQALISPSMLKLTRWIAERYLCSWGQVLECVVPAGVKNQAGTRMVTVFELAQTDLASGDELAAIMLFERVIDWPLSETPPPFKPAALLRIMLEFK